MAHLDKQSHVRYSKTFSYILRHGAVKEGYDMSPEGFVLVDDILAKKKFPLSYDDVQWIVDNNEKKRFRTKKVGDKLFIAANQGHSAGLGLDETLTMKEITDPADVPVAIHGTYAKCIDIIKKEGLCRMERQHIHMAPGMRSGVISGMRSNCEYAVYVDIKKCLEAGLKVFLSENNVILTPGDENGYIKPELFAKIERI
eukprot:TRINITY_DN20189_c0_g1_i3.p1 TRINITY_DN20189_c0_g1~~TRINITY_DN20189_c0_g1_i3.p1  ORF type:complete len:199 (+),score=27.76 TRINITY_DN20189_c0_g1_i3:48-644(+)